MQKFYVAVLVTICSLLLPARAEAEEVFLGGSFQGVGTPFTYYADEHGANIQFGVRGKPETGLSFIGKPSLYVLGSIIVDGYTNIIASGLSWKFGDKVYIRPGIGLALHDRNAVRSGPNRIRTDLGSPILFEPEIAVGTRLSERMSAELSWVHVSHAQLLSGQNPGLDMMGIRIIWKTH